MGWVIIIFIAAIGWKVAIAMDANALAMAVGVLLGILAGIPVMLLAMAGRNRHGAPYHGDVHNHFYGALPLPPKVAHMEVPVPSLPGYQVLKVQGEGTVWIKKYGTDKEWIMSTAAYAEWMTQNQPARLEDKRIA